MCVYFVVWDHNLRMKVLWSQHSQMTSPFALINPWLLLQLKSLSLIMSMGHIFLKVLNLLYHCCGTSHYVGLLVQIYLVWQAVYTYESNVAVQLSSQTLHVLLTCAGDFFQDLQPLVQSALDGYNVSIFSYGQTGSGKTHTMVNADFLLNIIGV